MPILRFSQLEALRHSCKESDDEANIHQRSPYRWRSRTNARAWRPGPETDHLLRLVLEVSMSPCPGLYASYVALLLCFLFFYFAISSPFRLPTRNTTEGSLKVKSGLQNSSINRPCEECILALGFRKRSNGSGEQDSTTRDRVKTFITRRPRP
jgi:hypothetical protein